MLIHAFQHSDKITTFIDTMDKKAKVEPDTSPSTAAGTGGTTRWRQNQQKLRDAVSTKTSRGRPPATSKFDGTCDGLKGYGLIFDSADLHVDRFTHVKREIAKYIGKEYTNSGDVWCTI